MPRVPVTAGSSPIPSPISALRVEVVRTHAFRISQLGKLAWLAENARVGVSIPTLATIIFTLTLTMESLTRRCFQSVSAPGAELHQNPLLA